MALTPIVQEWTDPSQLDWSNEPLLNDNEIKSRVSQSFKWTGVETMRLWKSLKVTNARSGCGGKLLEPFLRVDNASILAPTQDPFVGKGKHDFKILSGTIYLPAHLTASAEGREIHEGDDACERCQKSSNVRYPKCITAKDIDGKTTLNGACVACAYGSHWQQCSFVKSTSGEIDQAGRDDLSDGGVEYSQRDRSQPCLRCGFGYDETFFCACP